MVFGSEISSIRLFVFTEKGENISIDETSLPSPVRHDSAPAAPECQISQQKKNTSLEHEGRKRRLAALAARVKGWEDDIAHHDPPMPCDNYFQIARMQSSYWFLFL